MDDGARGRQEDGGGRASRGLVALAGAGVVAVTAMGFAPQLGALDPRTGFDDAIQPGTDGTVHFEGPQTSRRVDVQLLSVGPPDRLPHGVHVPVDRRVVAVRLRLGAARGADLAGCRVEVYTGGLRHDTSPLDGTPACGAGQAGDGPADVVTTVYLVDATGGRPTQVRVMWEPPAYAVLPAV